MNVYYVYATGDRPDGFTHAVGVYMPDGTVDGDRALFKSEDEANLFANAIAAHVDNGYVSR